MAAAESKGSSDNEEKKELFPDKRSSEEEQHTPVIKEKIVYKVVHVPYYYPVPVDAEYYYQNQDRFLRHRDRYDERIFDRLPPPSHSFSHSRRSREMYHKEIFPDEFQGSRSPSPESRFLRTRSPSSSPGQPKSVEETSKTNQQEQRDFNKNIKSEKDDTVDENYSESVKSIEENKSEADSKSADVSEKSPVDGGDNADKQSTTSNEVSSQDVAFDEKHRNRRKRYLMTFPYDQKNKSSNGESVSKSDFFNSDFKKFRSESVRSSSEYPLDMENRRYHEAPHKRSSHYYMSHSPSPPHTPYVMVPMRPIGVPSPDYIHERRSFKVDHPEYRSQKRRDIENDKESAESSSSKQPEGEEFDQDSKDVRYHSNGRRVRTVFSRQQLLTLNNVFQKHPFVSGERMSELSNQLGLDRKIVKIWFQNKRQNARKKGSLFERADDYYCEQPVPRKKSFDRGEEYYYDYPQDRYSNRSSPPTMAENW